MFILALLLLLLITYEIDTDRISSCHIQKGFTKSNSVFVTTVDPVN